MLPHDLSRIIELQQQFLLAVIKRQQLLTNDPQSHAQELERINQQLDFLKEEINRIRNKEQ